MDMSSKKIVIIASHIFPRISPRSMRATELAKELGRQGHEVTLYAKIGDYDYSEFEQENNIKVKSLGRTFLSKETSSSSAPPTLIHKVLNRTIKRLVEYPNIELIGNVVRILENESDIDLLISVAVPYPIHWGVARFRHKYPDKLKGMTWVADCGDPYMGNPLSKHPFYFKYIEKWFCKKTDYLTVPIEDAKKGYYPEFRDKIEVIPQGFNFSEVNLDGLYKGNNVPTFLYAGVFYPNIRDPRPFLDYLITLDIDFRFIVYTKSVGLLASYKERLGEKMIINDYIPRQQLLIEMSKADFLINFENNTSTQSPSKLIDYALCKRPVLSINSNVKLDTKIVNDFFNGIYERQLVIHNVEQYNITNVAHKFIELVK